VNQEKLGDRWQWILPMKYIFHTPQASLTCRKILRHETDGFTPPEGSRAMDLYALRNPSSSAWYEPENIASNGKHDNYFTTNTNLFLRYFILYSIPINETSCHLSYFTLHACSRLYMALNWSKR
jgi:hypothetical protein